MDSSVALWCLIALVIILLCCVFAGTLWLVKLYLCPKKEHPTAIVAPSSVACADFVALQDRMDNLEDSDNEAIRMCVSNQNKS